MRRAGLILFTHEHLDHVGGFLRSPAFASIAGKALITPEQLAGIRATRGLPWPPAAEARIRPFAYRHMAAVAPGVVLIKTPGHTAGSQMIFVRLANGHEFLFAGDTATMGRSWRWERVRSRLVGEYLAPEDRAAILGWLRALAELKRRAPSLIIVPGHDLEEITTPLAHSGVRRGFPAANPLARGTAESD
jgi:glyoxylase-like metal-dependent hydrolase (beta-lactamase superfamily II)